MASRTNKVFSAFVAVSLFAAGNSNLSAAPITQVGFWKLEETLFASPAVDSSGNGITGTYIVDANPNVTGAPGFGSGVAVDLGPPFAGRVRFGSGTALNSLSNDFSVLGWINIPSKDVTRRAIGNEGAGGWSFGLKDNNGLRFTTLGVQDYNIVTNIPLNTWTHIAAVMDASNDVTFYVNGSDIGTVTGTLPGTTPAGTTYSIGGRSGEQFKGYLDEFAVFEGSLSQAQIQKFMNTGFLVPEPSAFLLAAIGLLGLTVGTRRRNR